MSGGLVINTSEIRNTVTFVVDQNSVKEAKDSVKNLQKAFSSLQTPKLNFKRFKDQMRQAQQQTQKATRAASKPRDNSQREAERAAKAKARAEKTAAREQLRIKQRAEKAELKVLDTAAGLRNMQHLTNQEVTQFALQMGKVSREFVSGEKSLQRMNSEFKRLQMQARKLNAERKATAHNYSKVPKSSLSGNNGMIGGGLAGMGGTVLAGAGVGLAAGAAYNWSKDAISSQEDRSEIIARARVTNTDPNLTRALQQWGYANGVDSVADPVQGQRKLLDQIKDIQERTANSYLNAKYDQKTGQFKGGDQSINQLMNTLGFSKDDLKKYQNNGFGLVSSAVNTMQKKGYSDSEMRAVLEPLGDDVSLLLGAFKNSAKELNNQAEVLKKNGQWLNKEQQEQLLHFREYNQQMDVLTDSQKLAFFSGFMSELDPKTLDEFNKSMQGMIPVFSGLGKAAGDLATGMIKGFNWITEKFNILNGDQSTPEKVAQHYGTTSAPAQPGDNATANSYGASQPRQDGTHEHNIFDSMREWWNGTGDAKDVSSFSQPLGDTYSPVSILKQSYAPQQPAAPLQPVILQNNLPEGMITLNIQPDPSFGNMLNATVDQRISENNQRVVLAVTSGQSSTGG